MSSPDIDFFVNKKKHDLNLGKEIIEILDDTGYLHFHQQVSGYAPTPLHKLKSLARELEVKDIFVKDESNRFGIQAFKALGASYAVYKILQERTGKITFCTATDGNHGRALAWASRMNNCKCEVFVPVNTSIERINHIRSEGANVSIVDGHYDEAVKEARAFASQDTNHILVQDSSWEGYNKIPAFIMAGYQTMLKEAEGNIPAPVVVIVQGGVGSFPAAVAWYCAKCCRETKIIVTEPYHSDCILTSMKNGYLSSTQKSQKTIMAGLNCGTPSLLAYEILRSLGDVFISIPEENCKKAMKMYHQPLAGDTPVESGESGATGLATLLAIVKNDLWEELGICRASSFLLFNTEGYTDKAHALEILE